MNLLNETVGVVVDCGQAVESVAYVTSDHGSCTWVEYEAMAKDMDYDNGYGTAEVDTSLCVVFMDGSWLRRDEYDGAEEWVHCAVPSRVGTQLSSVVAPDPWA